MEGHAQLPERFFCFLVLPVNLVSGFTIPWGFAAFEGAFFLLGGERLGDEGERRPTLLVSFRWGATRFCSAVPSYGSISNSGCLSASLRLARKGSWRALGSRRARGGSRLILDSRFCALFDLRGISTQGLLGSSAAFGRFNRFGRLSGDDSSIGTT